jgi:hypothetical protein
MCLFGTRKRFNTSVLSVYLRSMEVSRFGRLQDAATGCRYTVAKLSFKVAFSRIELTYRLESWCRQSFSAVNHANYVFSLGENNAKVSMTRRAEAASKSKDRRRRSTCVKNAT